MLKLSAPCHEDWSTMTPMGTGRHCAACDQLVIDVAGLPVERRPAALAQIARQLAAGPGQRLCVRSHTDGQGHLVPVAPARRRVLSNAIAGILAMVAVGANSIGWAADAPAPVRPEDQASPRETMGDVCAPPAVPGGIVCAPPLTGEATVTPAGSTTHPAMLGLPKVAPEPREFMGKMCAPEPHAPGPVTPASAGR